MENFKINMRENGTCRFQLARKGISMQNFHPPYIQLFQKSLIFCSCPGLKMLRYNRKWLTGIQGEVPVEEIESFGSFEAVSGAGGRGKDQF